MSKETHVRIAGVCNCEVFEHCERCDPEFFKPKTMSTPDICFRSTKQQHDAWSDGGKIAVLTQDDIITLKLFEDFLRRDTLGNARTDESDLLVETLERILKQVV